MRVVVAGVVSVCLGVLVACGPMDGEPGPAGPQGEQGPPGVTAILTAYTACSTTVTVGGLVLDLIHQRYEYADGSVTTGCEAADGFYGYRGGYSFLSGQQGATLGVCHVFYDVDSPSHGRWEFNVRSGDTASSAVYADQQSAQNGFRATLNCQRFP